MASLSNRTALVTGASRGIGRATALALAKAGTHVLVHYGRSREEAESFVAATNEDGGRANAISADLGTRIVWFCSPTGYVQSPRDRLDVLVKQCGNQ